jgi:hydrogenase maturation factor
VAEDLLVALRASGYESAAVIGRVVKRESEEHLVVLAH